MSKFLANYLNAVYLTVPLILQSILDGCEMTALFDEIANSLEKKQIVPDDVILEAVTLVTSRVVNSGKGYAQLFSS
jgi:hypothetical protein